MYASSQDVLNGKSQSDFDLLGGFNVRALRVGETLLQWNGSVAAVGVLLFGTGRNDIPQKHLNNLEKDDKHGQDGRREGDLRVVSVPLGSVVPALTTLRYNMPKCHYQEGDPSQWSKHKFELATGHGRGDTGKGTDSHDEVEASSPHGTRE